MFVSISSEQIRRFLGFPNFSRTSLQNSQRFARKCPTFFVVTPWYLSRNYDFLLLLCEGCESKKCKIPDMRAHAHAWAGNWRLIFHLVFLIWWEDCFVLLIFPLQHQAFQKFLLDVLDNMYPFLRFRVHVLMICTHFGVFGYTFWWYVPVLAFSGTRSRWYVPVLRYISLHSCEKKVKS